MAPIAVFLPPLLSAVSGVFAHVAVFRRGEWDISSPSIFVFYATVFTAAVVVGHVDLIALPLAAVAQIAACHVVALYASMLVYRGFCHRLAGYPGPFLARLTTFYITARSMKKMHLFEEVQNLHAQYGDYVRVGKFAIWPPTFSVSPTRQTKHQTLENRNQLITYNPTRPPGTFHRRPQCRQSTVQQSIPRHQRTMVHPA